MKKVFLLFLFIFFPLAHLYPQLKIAAIGDYGKAGGNELNVSLLVKSWNPDLILTVGDNNYENGSFSTIDENIGQYYQEFIYPYFGTYGSGSPDSVNHFFPSLGNHDWRAPDAQPYLDYFTLPGNERYYDFVVENVHFFMLDSDPHEPDGHTESSIQGQWFVNQASASTSQWNLVFFHHPPYCSSSKHGSTQYMRWSFKDLGIDAVFAGHNHVYERLMSNNLVYFVDGLGGKSIHNFGNPLPETVFRYNNNYGAMLIEASTDSINFKFINVNGDTIDSYTIQDIVPVELSSFSAVLINNSVRLSWVTESELNNQGFSVERKTGNSGWISIQFVQGSGTTSSRNYYELIDTDIIPNHTYYYRLKQIDFNGSLEYSPVVLVEVGIPNKFYLSQNYPNPFNPTTRIDYTLPEKQMVRLGVYNMLGELITELVNEEKQAGSYSVTFNASNLPSGVYIYRLQTPAFVQNRKMIFLN